MLINDRKPLANSDQIFSALIDGAELPLILQRKYSKV